MLEITPSLAAVIVCLAEPPALDKLSTNGSFPCRVAHDELLLVGPFPAAREVEERAAAELAELDPEALVVNQTDAWSDWTLSGDDRDEAFARISAIPLPHERPAFLQGAVAGVQGKVLACNERTHILVVSNVGHYVRSRLFSACPDLEPRELHPLELAVEPGFAVTAREGVR